VRFSLSVVLGAPFLACGLDTTPAAPQNPTADASKHADGGARHDAGRDATAYTSDSGLPRLLDASATYPDASDAADADTVDAPIFGMPYLTLKSGVAFLRGVTSDNLVVYATLNSDGTFDLLAQGLAVDAGAATLLGTFDASAMVAVSTDSPAVLVLDRLDMPSSVWTRLTAWSPVTTSHSIDGSFGSFSVDPVSGVARPFLWGASPDGRSLFYIANANSVGTLSSLVGGPIDLSSRVTLVPVIGGALESSTCLSTVALSASNLTVGYCQPGSTTAEIDSFRFPLGGDASVAKLTLTNAAIAAAGAAPMVTNRAGTVVVAAILTDGGSAVTAYDPSDGAIVVAYPGAMLGVLSPDGTELYLPEGNGQVVQLPIVDAGPNAACEQCGTAVGVGSILAAADDALVFSSVQPTDGGMVGNILLGFDWNPEPSFTTIAPSSTSTFFGLTTDSRYAVALLGGIAETTVSAPLDGGPGHTLGAGFFEATFGAGSRVILTGVDGLYLVDLAGSGAPSSLLAWNLSLNGGMVPPSYLDTKGTTVIAGVTYSQYNDAGSQVWVDAAVGRGAPPGIYVFPNLR
jgi:hypothetical protein